MADADMVNHPPHYTSHPSGVECAEITDWLNFNLGSAFKYIWRAGLKWDTLEDLKKIEWYLLREIKHRKTVALNWGAVDVIMPDTVVRKFRKVLKHEAGPKAQAMLAMFNAAQRQDQAQQLEVAGEWVEHMIREIEKREADK